MTTAEEVFEDLDLSGLEVDEDKPKRTRKPRSDVGQPRGRRPRVSTLVDQLLVPYATTTTLLSMALPMTAEVMKGQGHKLVSSAVQLCAPHPKMMKALEKAAKIGPASDLVTSFLLLLLTAMVEVGRMPADNPIARSVGITDLYQQFYGEQEELAPNIPTQGPPPGFTFGDVRAG